MESIVQLLKGLENDLYLLGALILPMVVVVRLLIGSVQKAAGLEDALSLAWRDVIIATVSFVLTGVFKDYRLTTSDQLARVFFQANNAQYLCNKRLRILFDLHCINRFFPPTDKGSSRQHTALDIAGKKILGIDRYTLIKKLPITYKHTIHVTEAAIRLTTLGPHAMETNLGGAIADLYYPNHKLAVEIDTGAESRRSLATKIDRYRPITNIKWLLFITTGPIERIKYFVNLTKSKGCLFRTIGTQWQDLNLAISYILHN